MANKNNLSDIAEMRLAGQQLAGTTFKTPREIVGWMGALQAQDFNMAKWAVGVRLPGSTEWSIEDAFDKGEILRSHLLRPTWHLVSADDIYWLLELTAPHVKASLRSRHRELGLTQKTLAKSNETIAATLHGGRHLTREEMIAVLKKGRIRVNDPQGYVHLIMVAELEGIICSGVMRQKKQTYALLAERAPGKKTLSRDKALAELAKRYFASHGPATLRDFVWWSGLPAADARKSLELAGPGIVSRTTGSRTFWLSKSLSLSPGRGNGQDAVHLLPAFDEFTISYKDRSASIQVENHGRAVSSNGVFRPLVMLNGQVVGIWKRISAKDRMIVETRLFGPPDKKIMDLIKNETAAYGRFLNQMTENRWR
jgi:hypothetical protein